jgi:hypothetical protein
MPKYDLAELLTKFVDYKLATLRVCLPGKVNAYYAAKQTADIQPLIKSAVDLEDGQLVEDLPVLYDVPVEFPRGGGYVVMFPLVVGDTGMIDFCDFSIDLWRSSGQPGAPNDLRTHALGNAVFRPGLSPSTHPVANAPPGLLVGSEDGTKTIQLGSASATDFVVLESKMVAKFNAHTHPTGTGPSGPPSVLLVTTDVGSTVVKSA